MRILAALFLIIVIVALTWIATKYSTRDFWQIVGIFFGSAILVMLTVEAIIVLCTGHF